MIFKIKLFQNMVSLYSWISVIFPENNICNSSNYSVIQHLSYCKNSESFYILPSNKLLKKLSNTLEILLSSLFNFCCNHFSVIHINLYIQNNLCYTKDAYELQHISCNKISNKIYLKSINIGSFHTKSAN